MSASDDVHTEVFRCRRPKQVDDRSERRAEPGEATDGADAAELDLEALEEANIGPEASPGDEA